MKERIQSPYFNKGGLQIVMMFSAIGPVGMNATVAPIMIRDHLWIALLSSVLSLLCLFIVDISLLHLWSKLTEADRRRIGIRIPLVIILGAASFPYSPPCKHRQQSLRCTKCSTVAEKLS